MASTFKESFLKLWQHLQDPHHVARFQQLCGVRGTAVKITTDLNEGKQVTLSSNGSCANGIRNGRGEGYEASENLRQRTVTAKENCFETEELGADKRLTDTTTVTNSSVDTASPGVKSCRQQSGSDTTHSYKPNDSVDGIAPGLQSDASRCSSTIKPLRKNSLTGEVGQEFLIENTFLFYLFTLGTELGNELFYLTFFPFLIWNVDAYVGRQLIVVWVWVMYVGQCTKDLIRWPRPASPPVVKVEMFYNSEYSMPSTHAMSGTAIPLSLFLLTYGRWQYPFALGLTMAMCWCMLVCLSRIYMGMHSILDVIVGFLYSLLILLLFAPALEPLDRFNLSKSVYAPTLVVCVHVGLGLASFGLDAWSTSRADTAQILASGAGAALASHLNARLGLLTEDAIATTTTTMTMAAGAVTHPLRVFPPITLSLVGVCLLRFLLGALLLLATRALMKALAIPLVCRLAGVPPGADIREARRLPQVELPYRYIVYSTVGFSAIFLVPIAFRYLGLA